MTMQYYDDEDHNDCAVVKRFSRMREGRVQIQVAKDKSRYNTWWQLLVYHTYHNAIRLRYKRTPASVV